MPRFEEKDKGAIYFIIDITHNKTKLCWTLEKRFKEFEVLHRLLVNKLPNMPFLPVKSLFKVQGDALLKRKLDLEKYLSVMDLFFIYI